jgi:hypothetical protein
VTGFRNKTYKDSDDFRSNLFGMCASYVQRNSISNRRREEKEEDVSSYWMTLRKGEDIGN